MRNKLGIACMILGTALLLGALSLLYHNHRESMEAGAAADEVVDRIVEQLRQNQQPTPETAPEQTDAVQSTQTEPLPTLPDIYSAEMTVVELNGYGYIGYLTIASLGLELPVMAEWDYARLKIAPCRYTGSTKSDDLVVMAHNYSRHFGTLRQLKLGAQIIFTDMDGTVTAYTVAEILTMAPTAVEDMTAGEYPLTLFTCTYGGENRVTVRCVETEE